MSQLIDILLPSEKGAPLTRAEGEEQWQKVENAINGIYDGSIIVGDTDKLGGMEADKYQIKTDPAADSAKLGGITPDGYVRSWAVGRNSSSARWWRLCSIADGLPQGTKFTFLLSGSIATYSAGYSNAAHAVLDITLNNANKWGMALHRTVAPYTSPYGVTDVYSVSTTGTGVEIWLNCGVYTDISALCIGSAMSAITPLPNLFVTTAPVATTVAEIYNTIQQNGVNGIVKIPFAGGLSLPNVANSDSATLDWYEEGVWTPVVAGLTTAGTAVYTAQTGSYTRCGNRVTADFCAFGTFSSPPTGYPAIFGLPFSANNTTYAFSTGSVLHGYGTGVYIPYVEPAGVKVRLAKLSTAMAYDHTSPVFGTDISSSSFKMIGTITYHV